MSLGKVINPKSLKVSGIQWFVNSEHHFVGVNKMLPAGHPQEGAGIHIKSFSLNNQVRELETRMAENVVEILEA